MEAGTHQAHTLQSAPPLDHAAQLPPQRLLLQGLQPDLVDLAPRQARRIKLVGVGAAAAGSTRISQGRTKRAEPAQVCIMLT